MAVTPTFISAPATSSDGSGNLSSIGVGSAFSGRVVVFALLSSDIPTTATIGGVTATITALTDPLSGLSCSFVAAVVPTGTTANLVTNGSDFILYAVYTLPSGTSTTPSSTAVDGTVSAITLNLTLSPGAGDGAIALVVTEPTAAFTAGVTSDSGPVADNSNGFQYNVGSAGNLSSGSLTVTGTGTSFVLMYGATWAGASGPVDVTGTGAVPASMTAPHAAGTGTITPVWSIVGVTEAAINAATTSYTLTLPAGVQQDDIIVVHFATRGNASNVSIPWTNAAFTFAQSDSGGNATNNTTASDTGFQSAYCFRGASNPSMVFTRTGTVTSMRSFGTVLVYRSNVTGTPVFDAGAQFSQTTASTTVTLTGGITTANADELLVVGAPLARGSATTNQASNMHATDPSGASGAINTTINPVVGTWTERSDRGNTTSPTVSLACYDAVRQAAGATGNLIYTAANSALNGITVMAFQHPGGTTTTALTGLSAFKVMAQAAPSGTAGLVANSNIQLKANGRLSFILPMFGKAAAMLFGRGSVSQSAQLSGQGALQFKNYNSASGHAALQSINKIQVAGRGTTSGILAMAARSVAQVKASGQAALRAMLTATSVIAFKAKTAPVGILAMFGQSSVKFKAMTQGKWTMAMSARSDIQFKVQASTINMLMLAARAALQFKASTQTSLRAALSGISAIAAKASAIPAGKLAMTGLSSIKVMARAVPFLPGAVALVAQGALQFKATAQGVWKTALSARNTIQFKAQAQPSAIARLMTNSMIAVKAAATAAGKLPMSAQAAIKVKAQAAIAASVSLSSRAAVQFKAGLAIPVNSILQMSARSTVMFKAAAAPVGKISMSAISVIQVKGRALLGGLGPVGATALRIVKFIGNVGHMLIR